jgi:hypothetical protein
MDSLVAEGELGREPAQDAGDEREGERLGHRARQRHLLHEADREGTREIHDEGVVSQFDVYIRRRMASRCRCRSASAC